MIIVLNDRQFGKNLRFLRRKHHYSRVELANLICCFPADVRNWETGRSFDLDSFYLRNIRNLFGVSVGALIEDDLRVAPENTATK